MKPDLRALQHRAAAADLSTKKMSFQGILCPTNQKTNLGWTQEVFLPGAFSASIVSWAGQSRSMKILRSHDSDRPIGTVTEIQDRPEGVWIRGLLSKTKQGRLALEELREGVLDGLSASFFYEDLDESSPGLLQVRRAELTSASLVSVGAYRGAGVVESRSSPGAARFFIPPAQTIPPALLGRTNP